MFVSTTNPGNKIDWVFDRVVINEIILISNGKNIRVSALDNCVSLWIKKKYSFFLAILLANGLIWHHGIRFPFNLSVVAGVKIILICHKFWSPVHRLLVERWSVEFINREIQPTDCSGCAQCNRIDVVASQHFRYVTLRMFFFFFYCQNGWHVTLNESLFFFSKNHQPKKRNSTVYQ